jgi:hypothetical protein
VQVLVGEQTEDAVAPLRVRDGVRGEGDDAAITMLEPTALAVDGDPNSIAAGQPTTFRVHAEDKDGKLVSVQLFAKGYLRAETKVGAAQTEQTFTLSNLFEGDNTLIATAVDDHGHVGLSAPVRVKMKAAPAPAK